MNEDYNLSASDNYFNDQRFFERILVERKRFEKERDRRIEERFDALAKALELQATEYERRLHALNGEFERDRSRQHDYVTTDKWETTNEAEKQARETALLRVNEKFEDGIQQINTQFREYLTRYEADKREVDLRLAAQSGAQEEARRAAEDQGRKSDEIVKEQARKQSRNLAIIGFTLTGIIFAANFVTPLLFG